jgi:hypothetical protein
MKKILAVILICASFTLKAQDKIYGGLRIAPNYSLITDKSELYKSVKSGVGFSIGYYEVMELSYKINLQAEINYSNYSFKTDIDADPAKTNYKNTSYQSLELPISVKFRPNESFAFGVGYQFSFLPSLNDETGEFGAVEGLGENGGVKTSGFFLDLNGKSGKTIYGLRVTRFDNDLVGTDKLLNFSAYVGIGLF